MNRPVLIKLVVALALAVPAAAVFTPQPAAAQSLSIDGDWRGQSSGNVVRIREASGGMYVAAVTNNAGQSEPLYFVRTGSNEFRYTFPDGNQAVVTVGPGSMRIVNPDGWNDTFYPLNPRPAAPTYAPAPSSARTEGWPMPATGGLETSIVNAAERADRAARDALERAFNTPPAPPK